MSTGNLVAPVVFVAVLSIPFAAAAQGSADGAGEQQVTEYEFEKHEVEGGLDSAMTSKYEVVSHGPLKNLIEVRTNFIDAVQATVDDL